MSSLLRIVQLRGRVRLEEPYQYIIWWICLVDVNALLSGNIKGGHFIRALIRSGSIPTVDQMLGIQDFLGSGAYLSEEDSNSLAAAYSLQREIVLVSANIGFLRVHIEDTIPRQSQQESLLQHEWQVQSDKYHSILKRTWNSYMPPELIERLDNNRIFDGARSIIDAVSFTWFI